MTKWII